MRLDNNMNTVKISGVKFNELIENHSAVNFLFQWVEIKKIAAWQPPKNAKGSLPHGILPIFVNLKSNTMKKSQYKSTAFI